MIHGGNNLKEKGYLSLPGLLWRYKNRKIITAYTARFIFYFCIVCFFSSIVITLYSVIIQVNNPLFTSLNFPVLLAECTAALLFCIILILLIRGFFSIAANMLIITGLTSVWAVIYFDRLEAVAKLDSIVFIFAVLSMVPLVVHRRSWLLIIYVLINIPVLCLVMFSQREMLNLPDSLFYDYIADVTMALIFVCIVIWNVFFINRTALEKLKDDITKREDAGKSLQQSRDKIAALLRFQNEMFEAAAVWINTLDVNGNIVSWNKAAERISGYSKEEVIGHSAVWEWLYPDEKYRNMIYGKSADIISTGKKLENFETTIIGKDGDLRIISWNSNSLFGDNGEAVGSIALGADITELRREQDEKIKLEAQMNHMQKIDSIGRLAGGIAHDFNNLLTAILGTTELALRHLNPDDKLFHNFSIIQKASESAATLTSQLLLFSRKQIVDAKIIDLNEVMKHMSGMLVRMIGENIRLRTLSRNNSCRIKVDPGQIEQIIINLAVNARDAMPDGGELIVEIENVTLDKDYCSHHANVLPGKYVMLAVSDSGSGMSSQVQDHIYEPFFTTKESGKGTGLGLATVYGAVKQSGGSIELYSEEGHGTTFKIYFPCVLDEASLSLKPEHSVEYPSGNETILIVEDNPYVLDFSKNIIIQLGYNILTAVNGEEAVMQSADYKGVIHLMMTDVILPGINGRLIAEKIRESRPDMKVLYNSGYTGDLISRSGIIEEGIHFIGKPFSGHELACKIREILDHNLPVN